MQAMVPLRLSKSHARNIWLHAQRLDVAEPFGTGPEATREAIAHLGYLQIDTINVIERCHHHILFSRIPTYRRCDLHQAQTIDKSVFEYWTHAHSYVPTRDLRFFLPQMKRHRTAPLDWFATVKPDEYRRLLARIRSEGPLSLRDIDDDVLVEKDHAWASRKPSRRALQLGLFNGALTISQRQGMLKTYDLIERHFGWERRPAAASERQVLDYLLDRALRAQGLVSLDSICHLDAPRKAAVAELIAQRRQRGKLVEVAIEGCEKVPHWAEPAVVAGVWEGADRVHILSPFDPLIIQRKRLKLFFDYDHRFEAYLPREKRVLGYFALPVLVGAQVVAALDLKADRAAGRLLVQSWTWFGDATHKARIEEELHRFERFQLQS